MSKKGMCMNQDISSIVKYKYGKLFMQKFSWVLNL